MSIATRETEVTKRPSPRRRSKPPATLEMMKTRTIHCASVSVPFGCIQTDVQPVSGDIEDIEHELEPVERYLVRATYSPSASGDS